MTGEGERLLAQRQRKQGGGDDEAVIPIVKQKYISSIEWSHQRCVAVSCLSRRLTYARVSHRPFLASARPSLWLPTHPTHSPAHVYGYHMSCLLLTIRSCPLPPRRSVADLQWLPGLEVTPKGKLAAAGDSRECNFFATLGTDGKVMFWDLRVERLAKKKKKSDEEQEWRAVSGAAALKLGQYTTVYSPRRVTETLSAVE